jgi:hypothetical protein
MKHLTLGSIALVIASAAAAQTESSAPPLSGQLRLQWDQRQASMIGPQALADAVLPGTLAAPGNGATVAAELRSSGKGWNASATLEQQTQQGVATQKRAWVNELVASHDAGSWQFSAGKKIVAWDVGYAFRPNDVVQQEERRTLISTLDEGRPVLMAEHFDADSAWSWVWVNPTKAHAQTGPLEPALAARVYQHHGNVDWHGFARLGAHTGGSVGTALSWVASDTTELHASARWLQRYDSLAINSAATGLTHANPWQASTVQHPLQALIGGTWTSESQLSLLGEAWWDGTAPTEQQWNDWRARNALLAHLATVGAPASAVAGNLAWQENAFNASSNLQRANLYLRLSWDYEAWQPALDLLYQPADGGRMLTAALLWKGDRVQLQGGLRTTGGPANAVLTQLPTRRQAYLTGTWSF